MLTDGRDTAARDITPRGVSKVEEAPTMKPTVKVVLASLVGGLAVHTALT